MIIEMTSQYADGTFETGAYSMLSHKHYALEGTPVVMIEKFHGLVLSEYERNFYHDSDFYAVIWDEEKNEPFTYRWATTRGWCYPNKCFIDATPEVREKYNAYNEKLKEQQRIERQKIEKHTAKVGMKVRSTTKKGKAKGAEGFICWIGDSAYGRAVKIQCEDKMVYVAFNKIECTDDANGDWFVPHYPIHLIR